MTEIEITLDTCGSMTCSKIRTYWQSPLWKSGSPLSIKKKTLGSLLLGPKKKRYQLHFKSLHSRCDVFHMLHVFFLVAIAEASAICLRYVTLSPHKANMIWSRRKQERKQERKQGLRYCCCGSPTAAKRGRVYHGFFFFVVSLFLFATLSLPLLVVETGSCAVPRHGHCLMRLWVCFWSQGNPNVVFKLCTCAWLIPDSLLVESK